MITGRNTQTGVTISDSGVLGDEADIGHERDRKPSPHCDTIDGGNDDLLAPHHAVNQITRLFEGGLHAGIVLNHGRNPFQIAPGRERFALSGDHHDPSLLIVVDVSPDSREASMQHRISGIHGFRAIDGDQQYPMGMTLKFQVRII